MLRYLFLTAMLLLSTALAAQAADVTVEKYDIEIPPPSSPTGSPSAWARA